MAVTGKFAADFASFYDAVQKAEVSLRSFETNAGRVERQLNTTVNAFSGVKIFQEAEIAVRGIEQIGGAARLTESEQRRINTTLNEALEKYRAFGIEAPEAVRKLHAETTKVPPELAKIPTSTQSIISSMAPLAGAFGIAFSAGAVISFGKELLADADAMVKLSDKTGIAIEPMQRLKYAAEQSGNTIEQITGAVSQMQNRIAEGDKSAVEALARLGLSFAQLKNLSPDQQFIAIAREVAAIEDPMLRTKTAMDLFGRAGAEILPTMTADIKALGDEAPVMSEKAVKAFDDIGDTIDRVWTGGKTLVGESIGSMIDGYTRLGQAGTALVTGDFARVPEIIADVADVQLPKVPPAIDAVVTSMRGLTLSASEMKRIEDELTASARESIRAHEAQQRAQDALFGRDLIKRALEYQEQLGEVGNITKLTENKKKELKAAVDAALEAYHRLGEQAPPELVKISVEAGKTRYSMAQIEAELEKMNSKTLPPFVALLQNVDRTLDPIPEKLEAIRSEARFAAETIEDDMVPALKELETVAARMTLGAASRPFGDFEAKVGTPSANLSAGGTDPRVRGYLLAGYSLGEAISLSQGISTNILGPSRRAMGGPVSAGTPYLVGEQGPELYVPQASGSIVPNGGLGGMVVNINVNGSLLSTRDELARMLSDALVDFRRHQGGRLVPAGV